MRDGREPTLTTAEVHAINCPQIALEIAKCDGFMQDVQTKWDESRGRRFLGFVGDFGIGNHMEYNDAMESALDRRKQLTALQAERQCTPLAGPPPTF